MSIYDKASLVLIPSGTKTSKVYSQVPVNGDGDFTFSRSTAATRVNADGNIEKETQNLLLQSNSFTTGWSLSNVTMTSGQAGYDGTNDAWLMTDTNSGGYGIVDRLVTTGGITTFSCYAKSGTTDIFGLRPIGGSSPYVFFNLSNGTFESAGDTANLIDWDIQDAGNGWYRCSVTTSATATQVLIYIATTGGGLAPSGSTIYIQDAQVEQGLVARDYIETTTAAVEGGITDNVPRLDYTDSSCPSLLLEPSRTNKMTHSEYFGAWTPSASTIVSNASTSPEGVDNASLIYPSVSSASLTGVYLFTSKNTTATFSCFVKSAGKRYAFLGSDNSISYACAFDLTTGEVVSEAVDYTATIEDYGSGWYRITASYINSRALNYPFVGVGDAAGGSVSISGTDGLYIYGFQYEHSSSYATSYIPTYGTSVTRNGDSTEKTSIGDLLGQTEGTFYTEFTIDNLQTAYANILTSNHSTTSSVYMIYRQNNRVTTGLYVNGNTIEINSTSTYTRGDVLKVAFTYKNGDLALYINGQSEGSLATTWSFANTIDTLYLANSVIYFAYQEQVRMRQALIFKTRLSNEELAALTTI
jgi:hypothetical protein